MYNIEARLVRLNFQNFKNVKNGDITFKNYSSAINHRNLEEGDVAGIYGPNGSGKTASVEVLHILQCIFRGESIPVQLYSDLIASDASTRIDSQFYVKLPESQNAMFMVIYSVSLEYVESKKRINVVEEQLLYKTWGSTWKGEQRLRIVNPYICQENVLTQTQVSFDTNMKGFNKVSFASSADKLALLSQEQGNSILFNPLTINETEQNLKNNNKTIDKNCQDMLAIMSGLHFFAQMNFQVIRGNQLGTININTFLPLMLYQREENFIGNGQISLLTEQNNTIAKEMYNPLMSVINEINIALKGLISNLSIQIEKKDDIVVDDKEYITVNIFAIRNGHKFSIKNESMGVKRIISLLAYMIAAFNNPEFLLIVDELDDGIFEFLLGELIGTMGEEARGQLIFTSHNLRVMEKLPYKDIICTTTNPDNRYIKLKHVGSNNNKRDFYLRALMVGGQDEELYDLNQLDNISGALRAAYHSNSSSSDDQQMSDFMTSLNHKLDNMGINNGK